MIPIDEILLGGAEGFVLLAVGGRYGGIRGPTMEDRIIAVNVLGTSNVVILAVRWAAIDVRSFLDIALGYALLNFLMAVAISKFTVDRGGVM